MGNVPKLRFRTYSDEWTETTIGESSALKAGKFVRASDISEHPTSSLYPCYGGNGLRGYVSTTTHEGVYSLIGRQGALCGNVQLATGKFHATEHAVVVTPATAIDTKWLYYVLGRLDLNRFATGQAQPGLSVDVLNNVGFCQTSLAEQQKIAAFLTAVDTKIEHLTQKEALLKQYKKGVMQKIFSQEIRFKADDGSEFPEWEMKPLGSVFKEVTERVGAQDIETYSISAGKGFVSQKEKFGRDISGQQNEKYTVLRPNQFSYNKGNSKTYTYGCVYPNTLGHPIALPNVFISFDLIDSKYSVAFFAKLFENHYLDRSLRRIISSSARMDGLLNVNKADFFRIRLPVPSYKEQQKAGEFLSELDLKLVLAQQELEAAKTFKKGLLQQMFV